MVLWSSENACHGGEARLIRELWRHAPARMRRALASFGAFRREGSREDLVSSPQWTVLQERLRAAERVVDLGCGVNPHPRAFVGVDAYLDSRQRSLGFGANINPQELRAKHFVLARLEALPFADGAFDFAYTHHVFEHLENPKKASAEICRVARAGAVITPSAFSEIAFGRPYHLWLVVARGDTLMFIRKTKTENRPFGEHPVPDGAGGYRATSSTNPFEILLDYDGWYRGSERMDRLSKLLRRYWYSHSLVTEVVFLWEGRFNCVVVHEDGRLE